MKNNSFFIAVIIFHLMQKLIYLVKSFDFDCVCLLVCKSKNMK